jgi:hypothetical protein
VFSKIRSCRPAEVHRYLRGRYCPDPQRRIVPQTRDQQAEKRQSCLFDTEDVGNKFLLQGLGAFLLSYTT